MFLLTTLNIKWEFLCIISQQNKTEILLLRTMYVTFSSNTYIIHSGSWRWVI
jgi:hypothetical protein